MFVVVRAAQHEVWGERMGSREMGRLIVWSDGMYSIRVSLVFYTACLTLFNFALLVLFCVCYLYVLEMRRSPCLSADREECN